MTQSHAGHLEVLRQCLLHEFVDTEGPSRRAADDSRFIVAAATRIVSGREPSAPRHDWFTEAATRPLASIFSRFGAPDRSARTRVGPRLLSDPVQFGAAHSPDRVSATDVQSRAEARLKAALDMPFDSLMQASTVLSTLEDALSFVPSPGKDADDDDISWYDRLRLTGAVGSAIWHVLEASDERDHRAALDDRQAEFDQSEVFLLASFDISGIQDFIYTIHSSGAAKMLRARSFYLEMLAEHIIDELLTRLGLTRASLNYVGGGHAYLLLPNTRAVVDALDVFERELNDWFLEHFGTGLFAAFAAVAFRPVDIIRQPDEPRKHAQRRAQRHSELYRSLSETISAKKLHRYDAAQIMSLNQASGDGNRECRVCYTVNGSINADGLCRICAVLTRAAAELFDHDYLVVDCASRGGLPLPFGRRLHFASRGQAVEACERDQDARVYTKSEEGSETSLGIRLWMTGYRYSKEFSDYAIEANGIQRLAVLRLDVDDLGQAFTVGFSSDGGRHNTFSRTASFSRALSLFFRWHLRSILHDGKYRPLSGGGPRPRKVTVIYAGGDDVFVVGSWDDVIELAVELRDAFAEYTLGKLTLSAGIGMFPDKYPISTMATSTGDLEAAAKRHVRPGGKSKDAAALFEPTMVFGWDDLRDGVIGKKYQIVRTFFRGQIRGERGKSLVYRLLVLLQQRNEAISLARWVYVLSRLEAEASGKESAGQFGRRLHEWFKDDEDARQLVLALWLYLYQERHRTGE